MNGTRARCDGRQATSTNRPLLRTRAGAPLRHGCVALIAAAACLSGCSPAGDSALWSARAVQQELVLSRLTDAQRAEQAHALELQVADAEIQKQDQALRDGLQDCPGPRTPLAISEADTLRDSLRSRVGDDAARLQKIADLALADWYVRRANATGFPELCYEASIALAVQQPPQATTPGLSASKATVARATSDTPTTYNQPQEAIVAYALGWTDAVSASAPLPHYLAAVYGGSVLNGTPKRSNEQIEALVDQLAPSEPQWEPDAIWQALLVE
jgi:hypothetical protein